MRSNETNSIDFGPLTRRGFMLLRSGVGLFFLLAGLAKLFAQDATTQLLIEKGIPLASAVALAAGFGETLAGAMLVAGVRTRAVARGLIAVLVVYVIVFHDPLGLPPGVAHFNAVSLTIDLLVIGALTFLAVRRHSA